MKRNKMIEHIKSELILICEYYNMASDKAKLHKINNGAADILDMLEGFGMLPPMYVRYVDQENGNTLCQELLEWEPENETK